MPRRSAFIILATAATALAFGAVVVPQAFGATTGCRVEFVVHSRWATGYQAGVTMTNLGDPVTGWRLEFDFAGTERLNGGWGATWHQPSGSAHVTADNLSWNASLPTNRPVTIGYQATWSGARALPGNAKINGISCTGVISSPTPTTAAPSTATVPAPVIRLVGTIRPGVETGCMLLDMMVNRPPLLLIGGDRTIIVPGATVEVYGRYAPGTISYCMQGEAFQVLSVRRL